MKKLFTLGWLLMVSGIASAEPSLDDFAYGYRVLTPKAGALYELALPEQVYTRAVRADLGDVAIFNAAGETVPYAFRSDIEAAPVTPAPVTLPFYPLHEHEQDIPRQLTLRLQAGFDHALVELRSTQASSTDAVVAYLVDTEKLESPIERLAIDWHSPDDNLITEVGVWTSDDLSHWTSLAPRAALAHLLYAGNRLSQNHIALPSHRQRYLKISWPAGRKGAEIIVVRAEFATRNGERKHLHNRYEGRRADTEKETAFEYELPGYLPVDDINLELPQANSLLQGAVYSRADPDHGWRLRHRGLFYRLKFPEAELRNPVVDIATTSDRFWRVVYDSEASSLGADMPVLQVGWQPHRLVFLARGEGPFTLAYGSARTQARQAPVNRLIAEVKAAMDSLPVETATLGEVIQGDVDNLSPPPPPLPWRTWLLWASLVAGVLVLGVLALRLYRQLHAEQG